MSTDKLKELYDKYKLDKSDIFVLQLGGKHTPIITRSGIEKIQAELDINVSYKIVKLSDDLKNCVVKAYGEMKVVEGNNPTKVLKMQTYGEASPSNTKNSYTIAIAEKRALARVILKLAGLYKEGVFGEDEADEFKQK